MTNPISTLDRIRISSGKALIGFLFLILAANAWRDALPAVPVATAGLALVVLPT